MNCYIHSFSSSEWYGLRKFFPFSILLLDFLEKRKLIEGFLGWILRKWETMLFFCVETFSWCLWKLQHFLRDFPKVFDGFKDFQEFYWFWDFWFLPFSENYSNQISKNSVRGHPNITSLKFPRFWPVFPLYEEEDGLLLIFL